MTTKINLSNIDSEQDYSSLATTLFAKANVAANIANTALATASTILKVTSIVYPGDDTAADTAGGQTITLTGTGFVSGASVLINGSAVGVVSVANSTTLTFTSPSANSGSYVIYIVNPDGGTAISIPGIQYSGTPTWTTAAGSLGSLYETAAFGNTVIATGDTVSYSLQSGTLPPGATFSSNGTITGTSSTLSSPTTYTFTVRATDAQNQDTDRSFSITINPDAVTWSSPTTNTSYTLAPNTAMSNVTLSASSAVGANIFYSANTLPTGVSLTGNTIFGTPTVTDETRTSLVTATANTTSESSSIVLNWTVSVAGEPFFKYNSLLLSGDGTNNAQNNTFLDGSTNNFTITRSGNTTQGTFSPYGPNWSNYFTGVSDYLAFPTVTLGSNYTIEFFVNFPTAPSANNIIISNANGGGGTNWIGINTSVLVFSYGGTNRSFSFTPVAGTWYYIQIIGTASTVSAYVNGAQIGTTQTGPTSFAVDRINGYPSLGFAGYLSNVRLTNAANSASATPTIPLTAISNCVLLTCQSNRFIDNSSSALAITTSGSPTVQRFSPFSPTQAYSTSTIGGSGYFDGTGDYLTLPAGNSWLFTGDHCLEAWVYWTFSQNSIIYATGNASSADQFGFFPGEGIWWGATSQSSAVLPTLNAWNHVCVTRQGTTIRRFLNGQLITTSTVSGNIGSNSATPHIGRRPTSGVDFIGNMGDLRIINGSVPTSYQTSSTTINAQIFTPPTAPLTTTSQSATSGDVKLLLSCTNAGIIDNAMMNNLETVGDAKISSTQSKFGGTSMSFDGTGDYLTMPSSPQYSFGTGDFTVEGWFYINAGSGTNNGALQISSTAGGLQANQTNTIALSSVDSGGLKWSVYYANTYASGSAVTTQTWTHVAIVRSSGSLKLYINGTVDATFGTKTDTTNYTGQNIAVGGYYSTTYLWNGYIDDLRITKGYARYTSNFTAPTTAHAKL